MCFGFDSRGIKIGMGFILLITMILFTDLSTPLCRDLLNTINFDALKWIKALVILALCFVFSLSLLFKAYVQSSAGIQIKKALKRKEALNALGHSHLSLELKVQKLNLILKEMRSHLDLMAHYPELDFKEVVTAQDYDLNLATVFRVIAAYSRTLSDEYYEQIFY